MNLKPLVEHCRRLPHVAEDVKWGDDLVFSVVAKMFCVFSIEGGKLVRVSFKVDEHRFLEFTDRPQFVPAPYMARAHWVSLVDARGLTLAELKALVAHSRELVIARLPKKTQAGLAATAPRRPAPRTARRGRAARRP